MFAARSPDGRACRLTPSTGRRSKIATNAHRALVSISVSASPLEKDVREVA